MKMKSRFDMIEKLRADIATRILKAVEDPAKYREFFKNLIVQVSH